MVVLSYSNGEIRETWECYQRSMLPPWNGTENLPPLTSSGQQENEHKYQKIYRTITSRIIRAYENMLFDKKIMQIVLFQEKILYETQLCKVCFKRFYDK